MERIGYYEHVVVEGAKDLLRSVWPIPSSKGPSGAEEEGDSPTKDESVKPGNSHGVLEAEKNNSGEGASTCWCFLAFIYYSISVRCADPIFPHM